MKPGDLIRTKEDCGAEGQIGVMLESGGMFWTVSFPDGAKDIDTCWDEVIDETQPNWARPASCAMCNTKGKHGASKIISFG
jgi:hypothetical protein